MRVVKTCRGSMAIRPEPDAFETILRPVMLVSIGLIERLEARKSSSQFDGQIFGARLDLGELEVDRALGRMVSCGVLDATGGEFSFAAAVMEDSDTGALPRWGPVIDAIRSTGSGVAASIIGFSGYLEVWRSGRGSDGWAYAPTRAIERVSGYKENTLRRVRQKLSDIGLMEFHMPAGSQPRVRPGPLALPHLHPLPPLPTAVAVSGPPPAAPDAAVSAQQVVLDVGGGLRMTLPPGASLEVPEGYVARWTAGPEGMILHVEKTPR